MPGRSRAAPLALVIGATGDIGAATMAAFAARGLDTRGWDVKLPPQAALDSAQNLTRCDVLEPVDLQRAVDDLDTYGGDLCHVALIVGGGDLEELSSSDFAEVSLDVFRRVVDLNLTSVAASVKALLPALRRSEGDRSITLLSSLNACGGYGAPGYSAAKAALSGLAKALAPALGRDGIRINVVVLGTVLTGNLIHLATSRGQNFDAQARGSHIPLGRILAPEDVADAVLSLALDLRACTGADLVLDNGQSLGRP